MYDFERFVRKNLKQGLIFLNFQFFYIVKLFTPSKTLVEFAYTQQLTVNEETVSDLMVSA